MGQLEILMPEVNEEIALRPSRLKAMLLLLVCALFVLGGCLMIQQGKWLGWVAAGFFGLGCVAAIIQMWPGSSELRLTPHGFEIRTLFRAASHQWHDVSEFSVTKIRQQGFIPVHSMVCFDMSASGPWRAIGQVNQLVVGRNAALPDTYGLKAERLAELMNAWRSAALAVKSKTPAKAGVAISPS